MPLPSNDLITLAQTIGARPDYTQGGGGNVSQKTGDLMHVKASGLRLGDLAGPEHFVTIDYEAVRNFHNDVDVTITLPELIAIGDVATRASIKGEATGRPSIETGFHALLGETVLHTHSVYANVLTCAHEGTDLIRSLFPTATYVPYNTPGIALTLAIKAAQTTPGSDVFFLENHGLIVVAPTPEAALETHEVVNNRIRTHLQLINDYPTIAVVPTVGGYTSASPTLTARLQRDAAATLRTYPDTILFPDQVVYGDALRFDHDAPAKVTIDSVTGQIMYACSDKEALAIEETLAAWLYLHDTITALGFTHKTLAAAEGVFITNLDSEQYRKSIM